MSFLDSIAAKLEHAVATRPAARSAAPNASAATIAAGPASAELTRTSRAASDVSTSSAVAAAAPARPIVQLDPVHANFDPATYSNPKTPTNPNGTLLSLFAFRALVDPVPAFTKYYTPSGVSTEQAYGNLLQGAAVTGAGFQFASQVLANALRTYDMTALASLDGTIDPWRPVYADPPNWYEVDPASYQALSVSAANILPGAALELPASSTQPVLGWQLLGGSAGSVPVPIDPTTQLTSASLRYLIVDIQRPWLDFTVFSVAGWSLQGQDKGFYSTGLVTDNAGLMPLLPVSIILGTNATVTASWGPADRSLLAQAADTATDVALGPLRFRPQVEDAKQAQAGPHTMVSSAPFIVGWVSRLVPMCPPESGVTPR